MHLSIIDAIRGLAALLVALDHGLLPRELPFPFDQQILLAAKVLISGPAAVLVFFVVSGFCIHGPNVGRVLNAREFIIRRIVRLGLPFLAASCVAYAVGYEWFSMPFGEPAIWSLACELVYYFLYLFIQPRLTTKRQWLIAVVCLFVLALVVGVLGRDILEYPRRNFFALCLMGLPIWLSGCFLAHLVKEKSTLSFTKLTTWLLWLTVVLGGGVAAVLKVKFGVSYAITLTLYGAAVAPWMWSVLGWEVKSGALKVLGDSSYSIYLLHQPLIPVVRQGLSDLLPRQPIWLVDLVVMVAVLAALLAFYYLFEKPSHRLARRLSPSSKNKEVPV